MFVSRFLVMVLFLPLSIFDFAAAQPAPGEMRKIYWFHFVILYKDKQLARLKPEFQFELVSCQRLASQYNRFSSKTLSRELMSKIAGSDSSTTSNAKSTPFQFLTPLPESGRLVPIVPMAGPGRLGAEVRDKIRLAGMKHHLPPGDMQTLRRYLVAFRFHAALSGSSAGPKHRVYDPKEYTPVLPSIPEERVIKA